MSSSILAISENLLVLMVFYAIFRRNISTRTSSTSVCAEKYRAMKPSKDFNAKMGDVRCLCFVISNTEVRNQICVLSWYWRLNDGGIRIKSQTDFNGNELLYTNKKRISSQLSINRNLHSVNFSYYRTEARI